MFALYVHLCETERARERGEKEETVIHERLCL